MTADTAKLTLRDYQGEVLAHAHRHHQFVLPLRGALELESRGRGGFVDDARAALVSSGDRHAFLGHRSARCIILDIPEAGSALLDTVADKRGDPFFAVDPALHHLLRFIEARGMQDADMQALLLATALDSVSDTAVSQEPQQLRRAIGYMEQNWQRPISIADIAASAAVSESRLFELFRTWIGTSPQAHLTAYRIRRAKTALINSPQAISGIALECGFSDQTAFTRAFRRITGTTPAAYRRAAHLHLDHLHVDHLHVDQAHVDQAHVDQAHVDQAHADDSRATAAGVSVKN